MKYLIKVSSGLLLLLTWVTGVHAVNVTGNVTLEGETDYSGVKVVYKATSGTAVDDSTTTDSNGDYSLSLTAGNYEITLSKTNFKTIVEGPYFISSDQNFNHGEMLKPTSYVILDGSIKDTLFANVNYVVPTKVTIEIDDSLFIEAGAVIKFYKNAQFWIKGVLISLGEADNMVHFKMHEDHLDTRYMGIYVENPNASNTLSYMKIDNARHGIQVREQAFFGLENCILSNSNQSSVVVEDVDSIYFSNTHFDGFSIGVNAQSTNARGIIENCEFYNYTFNNYALAANFYIVVRKNRFVNNYVGLTGSPQVVERNLFVYNEKAISGYGGQCDDNCFIRNNTFHGNRNGLGTNAYKPAGKILMNCFTNNQYNFFGSNPSYGYFTYSYNFLAKPAQKNVPALGMGIPLNTNHKGDSTDTHFNVIEFEVNYFTMDLSSRFAFYPHYESVLVDAGNPNYKDDDGSIRDIGAFAYVTYLGEEKFQDVQDDVKVYPNPFNDYTNFALPQNENFTIQIFDANGKLVFEDRNLKNQYQLSANSLGSGLFFYYLLGDKNQYSGKLLIR